jgi:hypothetical protein
LSLANFISEYRVHIPSKPPLWVYESVNVVKSDFG